MGARLAAKVAEIEALGPQAKVKLALLTGLTKDKAAAADDSPELLAKVDDARQKIKEQLGV